MIRLPIPDPLDGLQLTEFLNSHGLTNVSLLVDGDSLCINADEIVSGVPSDEQRSSTIDTFTQEWEAKRLAWEAERQTALVDTVNKLEASTQADADKANADLASKIAPLVADFKPVPPPPPPVLTAEEKLAALGLTTDDLKALLNGS